MGASPMEGSSSSSTRGRAISARPMASICCSPPERVPASCLRRSASRGKVANTQFSRSSWAAFDSNFLPKQPISMFSITDIPGKTPRPSGAWMRPSMTRLWALTRLMSRPSNHTEPFDNGSRPDTARINVVLPAPLEPSRVTSSPARTTSDTPCSASILP